MYVLRRMNEWMNEISLVPELHFGYLQHKMINRIDTLLQVDFSLNFGPSQKLVFDLENWALVAFTARSHQSLINNSNNKWARNSDYQLNMNMDQSTLGIVSIICACKNVMWIFGTKPMKCPLSFFRVVSIGESHLKCVFRKSGHKVSILKDGIDGHADSIRLLLNSRNYLNHNSEEHVMVQLLTTSI